MIGRDIKRQEAREEAAAVKSPALGRQAPAADSGSSKPKKSKGILHFTYFVSIIII